MKMGDDDKQEEKSCRIRYLNRIIDQLSEAALAVKKTTTTKNI